MRIYKIYKKEMDFKTHKLNNQMKLVTVPLTQRQSASFALLVKAGGRNERSSIGGISHFIEHLVFRGTKNRTAIEIKNAIEGIGGVLNAFTSEEFTGYYAKVPGKHISDAIEVISDLVLEPVMAEDDIIKEKRIIVEEIRMYQDVPAYHVHELLDNLMWGNHQLGKPLAGTYRSVHGITRDKLTDFKKKYYVPNNMIAVVSGSYNEKQTAKLFRHKFSALKKRPVDEAKKFTKKQAGARLKILDKETQQTHAAMGFHTPGRKNRGRYALALLSVIMGGNMSSRLFEQVREHRGLAYQISTVLKKYQETGAFVIKAGLKNRNLPEAVKIIMGQLHKIKKEPVGTDELSRAKEYLLSHILMEMDDTLERALWLGEKIISGDTNIMLKDVIKKIKSVSREDIRTQAQNIFKTSNLSLAVIGPAKSAKKQINNTIKECL